jgi:signal transduction histidine kinase
MGARMREFDWSGTPLGGPADWPQSLKTIVRVMLDSRFAMWMLWGAEQTFFCNDAYLPTVGIKREWVLGSRADKVWAEIWHDIGPRIDRVLSTGTATWDEGLQLFLRRSGYEEETFHTFSYSPVYDDQDRISGMLCVVVEDTDRIIGARRLRLLRELAASPTSEADSLSSVGERLFQVLESNAADIPLAALYLTDASGSSARLTAQTGSLPRSLAPEEIRFNADAATTWPVAPAVLQNREQQLDDVTSRIGFIPSVWPEPVNQVLSLPLAGSGQARPLGALILGVSPRRTLDANYRSFFSLVASQISSKLADSQAHLEERSRSEALAELDRAKNVFFGNVSHEFRTPLTLMLGPIEELIDQDGLPQDARESLELIHRNALRLKKLVNSMLDFSRIEAGRVEASYQSTDLARLTQDIASVFRSAMESAGLRLVVKCDVLPLPVFVDRDMWEKVVLNLLSNAFKFTLDGEVEVTLESAADSVLLQVRDTGVGIAADELPHVFDRFHRIVGTRSRTQEGTGIGLALVKELVRLHGGTVDVTSEIDKGTCFTVSIPFGSTHLPRDRIQVEGSQASTRTESSSYLDDVMRGEETRSPATILPLTPVPSSRTNTARILVVDDNADMRAYIERLLSPYWGVTLASDGLKALEAVAIERPSLVITDLMMPNLDGYGLIRHFRENPSTATLPVIVLSAQAGEEARISGLHRGADDYLVKPFSHREIVARVQAQLMRAMMRDVQGALDKRLADVFRYAPVGMALLRGPDHVFEFVNEQYRKLVSGRDVLGLPIRTAFSELEGQSVFELLDGVYSSGNPYIGRAFPLMLLNPEKNCLEQHFFDFVYQPLSQTDVAIDGIAVVVFEVTELMIAQRQAESASRAKDEFIAMLGHELRNPLAPIETSLALMRMQWGDVAVKERGIIERQVQHMVRLVDDLLDIARVTRGTIELKRSVIELSAVVGNAVETTSPLFEQKRQFLRVNVPQKGLPVLADSVRLCQVIANLLTNAAKFSEVAGHISLDAVMADDQVELRVQDHGMGMLPEDLKTVFEPFVQGSQSLNRPHGGLGLGLAIARSLASLHGGTLSARSEGLGRGSAFCLRLPLAQHQKIGLPNTVPLSHSVGGELLNVLVVDDNEDAALTTAMLLSAWGYIVQVAHDGPAALNLLDLCSFDIALLDIGLPVMDGYELAQRIRALEGQSSIRLIALTGYGQDADRLRSLKSGFDAHLVKPVDAATLGSALRAMRNG